MNTSKKVQLGPRVKRESHDTLQRLAGANSCSVAYYVEQVLEEHVKRQRHPDAGGGVMHELATEINEHLAANAQHLENAISRELAGILVRLERQLDAVKTMIDALVRTLSPKDHEAYVKNVRSALQKLGPLFEGGNGRLQ
jgi:hypothetical protein